MCLLCPSQFHSNNIWFSCGKCKIKKKEEEKLTIYIIRTYTEYDINESYNWRLNLWTFNWNVYANIQIIFNGCIVLNIHTSTYKFIEANNKLWNLFFLLQNHELMIIFSRLWWLFLMINFWEFVVCFCFSQSRWCMSKDKYHHVFKYICQQTSVWHEYKMVWEKE